MGLPVAYVRDALEESYRGHHQYHWVRPRKTWIDAACPVYIDFGEGFLARLETCSGIVNLAT